jgi:hypothetical protein
LQDSAGFRGLSRLLKLTDLCYAITDFLVACAAAEIAGECLADLVSGGIRVFVQQVNGSHQDARGTDSTLSCAVFNEGVAQPAILFILGESFNCSDLSAVDLQNRNKTTIYQYSIKQNSAGAAFSFAASFFDSGKAQFFS